MFNQKKRCGYMLLSRKLSAYWYQIPVSTYVSYIKLYLAIKWKNLKTLQLGSIRRTEPEEHSTGFQS